MHAALLLLAIYPCCWSAVACKQHEHYYYDGVRRIQEQWYVETANCTGTPTASWITKREYIHGVDYVDEFIAQVLNPACDCAAGDTCGGGGEDGSSGGNSAHCGGTINDNALAVFYLHDANYNVVATLDDGCPDDTCGSGDGGCPQQGGGGTGSGYTPDGPIVIYEQYTYEPYGQPSSVDKFVTTPPQNAVGHQGLIFDRYCGNTPTDPCILTSQKGLYHNRNRYYHAKLGRFTTPDPNSSALPLIEGIAFHGLPPTALALVNSGGISDVSSTGQYGDGMSLYSYLQSNAITRLDPSGRFVIGTFGDLLGSTAIRTGLTALDAGGKVAVALDFYTAIAGGMSWRNALTDLVINAAYNYAGGKLFDAALGAAVAGVRAINNSLSKGIRKGLGEEVASRGFTPPRGLCIVEGTLVLSQDGYVPIECLTVGDRVITPYSTESNVSEGLPDTFVDYSEWQCLTLVIPSPQSARHAITIQTLQPCASLGGAEYRVGERVPISLSDVGIAGIARITDVSPCPAIDEGAGSLVLTTIANHSAYILGVWLEDTPTPLELTNTHQLFLDSKNSWVKAGELVPGDYVRTKDGAVQVVRVEARSGIYPVHNIEVATEHCYFVSERDVLTHNQNACAQPLTGPAYERHIRGLWGGDDAFKIGGREFDGSINGIWFELKGSTAGFKDWKNLQNQLGSQVAIARQNGHEFMLVTSSEIPSDFAAWLASKGIGHVVQP